MCSSVNFPSFGVRIVLLWHPSRLKISIPSFSCLVVSDVLWIRIGSMVV
jgi:hypothetical protein